MDPKHLQMLPRMFFNILTGCRLSFKVTVSGCTLLSCKSSEDEASETMPGAPEEKDQGVDLTDP